MSEARGNLIGTIDRYKYALAEQGRKHKLFCDAQYMLCEANTELEKATAVMEKAAIEFAEEVKKVPPHATR